MKCAGMIKIDGEKLRKVLVDRNLALTYVSSEMGYNSAYISNAIARQSIAPAGAKMLDWLFSIPLDAYKADDANKEETVKVETVETDVPGIDYDKLYQIVYSAIYEAVKKVWSE